MHETQRWTVGDVVITSVVEEQTDHIPPEFFFPDGHRGRRWPPTTGWCPTSPTPTATSGSASRRSWSRSPAVGCWSTRASATARPRRSAVLERRQLAVPRALRRGRLRRRRHRHGRAHPPARRPRRVGHPPSTATPGCRPSPRPATSTPRPRSTRCATRAASTTPTCCANRCSRSSTPGWPTSSPRTSTWATACASLLPAGTRPVTSRCGSSRPARSGSSAATSCTTRCSARSRTWAEIGDADADEARATRRRMLAEAAATGALFIGTHFPTRPAGRVVVDGDVWRFVPRVAPAALVPFPRCLA